MLKTAAAVATALFVTASPLAYAQTPSVALPERISAADWNELTDLRIDLVKAALQLTPDQTKYWPPIENAIRARAEDRQARLSKIVETRGFVSTAAIIRKPIHPWEHYVDVVKDHLSLFR